MKMRETRRDAGAREDDAARACAREDLSMGAVSTRRRKVREGVVVSRQDGQDRRRGRRAPRAHPQLQEVPAGAARATRRTTRRTAAAIGDRVRIIETRPLSSRQALGGASSCSAATKRWPSRRSARGSGHDPGGDACSTSPTTPARARSCASRCWAARKRQVRLARRHHRGLGEGGDPERQGEEGRRDEGRDRAHRQGGRPRRRLLHPVRHQLGGPDRQRSASRSARASSGRWRASCARSSS